MINKLSKKFFLLNTLLVYCSITHALPICTPNLTPEQAFLAIKNANNPQSTQTPPLQPNAPTQAQLSTQTAPQPTANLININTATEAELVQLNGISSKKAQDIILYREMIAPFRTVDDLDKVKGIGKATIDKNRAIMTVGDGQTVVR